MVTAETATPAPPPAGKLRSRWNAWMSFLSRNEHEWAIVGLLVLAATLSALALARSTEAGRDAGDSLRQARLTRTLLAQRESTLAATIGYDVALVPEYGAAIAARQEFLSRQRWVDAAEQDGVRRSLQAMFIHGVPDEASILDPPEGGAYQAAFVANRERAVDRELRIAIDPVRLEEEAATSAREEAALLVATVMFAFAVVLATLADLTETGRWRVRWLMLGVASVLAGLIIAALHVGWPAAAAALLFTTGGMLLLGALMLWLPKAGLIDSRTRRKGPSSALWWAEFLAAMSVVGITVAALSIAQADAAERRLTARADQAAIEATRQLIDDQREAIADVEAARRLLQLEARAGNQIVLSGTDDDLEVWSTVRERIIALLNEGGVGDGGNGPGRGDVAASILDEISNGGPAAQDHVARSTEKGIEQTTIAALYDLDSEAWSDVGGAYTLSLVLLGLAGYVFSLAAGRDRRPATAPWLLLVATAFLGVGSWLLIDARTNSPAPIAAGEEEPDAYTDFARLFAAARVERIAGTGCISVRERLDQALALRPDFTQAYLERAMSEMCDPAMPESLTADAITPGIPSANLATVVGDVETTLEQGGDTVMARWSLGWARLLEGMDGDDAALLEGMSATEAALQLDPGNPELRFNRAIALLAADRDAEARDAYQQAVLCALTTDLADTSDPCDGEQRQDGFLESYWGLSAVADLELLATRDDDADLTEIQAIKEEVLSDLVFSSGDGSAPESPSSIEVFAFPQSLYLAVDPVPTGVPAIIWYYRPPGGKDWSLLYRPTLNGYPNQNTPAYTLLPPGTYRADLYVNGHFVGTGQLEFVPATDYRRVDWLDIGVSVAVPKDWTTGATAFGLIHALVSPDGRAGVALVRLEDQPVVVAGLTPDEVLDTALDVMVPGVMPTLGAGQVDPATAEVTEVPWFLDLENFRGRWYENATVFGALGSWQYCDQDRGTLMLAILYGIDANEDWFNSTFLSLERGEDAVLSDAACAAVGSSG